MAPSTTQSPYLVSTNSTVQFNAILSVGDQVGLKKDGVTPWKMAGIPDGLGAYDNGDGTMTVLMNHELGATLGAVRDHGATGAFVSKLVIDKTTFEVKSATDLIQTVNLYNTTTGLYEAKTVAFARFCSADLPAVNAFFDPTTGLGTKERIFMNGEETGPEGRNFAHIVTGSEAGTSYELARLGNFSSENAVANAFSGAKTVVASTDDATPGEVYIYVGDKQATGTTIEKAGLTNGKLFGIQASFGDDVFATPTNGTFALVQQGANGDVSNMTGAQLQAGAAPLTQFGRPEDSCWDPSNPNRLYVATTGVPATATTPGIPTRLFALDFIDVEHPELGGKITVVLEGAVAGSNPATGPVMIDNLTVTESGLVILQEDPGNNTRLAKVWMYDPKADNGVDPFSGLTELAQHDPARFTNPSGPTATPAPFGTTGFGQDEESSGVIDVTSLLGADKLTFMLDSQAHYNIAGELVEGGQLMTMTVDTPNAGDTDYKGTNGADTFDGGFGNDELSGRGGDDKLFGNYGNDELNGGKGNDMLDGGVGNDELEGGDGNDMLFGGVGNDKLEGGEGKDTLDGGVGDDVLKGDEGNDILKGNFGNDKLDGGSGDDQLFGNQGKDILTGGRGNDRLDGGGGDDIIYLQSANDGMNFGSFENEGNRTFTSKGSSRGEQSERSSGGDAYGNDTIVFGNFSGHDTLYGFDSNPRGGQDLIDVSGLGLTASTFAANVSITASGGSTLVSLLSGDTLLLKDIAVATITIDDFLLV
jgi:RTX calcium-binding nonapeptide repeat (4 copies)